MRVFLCVLLIACAGAHELFRNAAPRRAARASRSHLKPLSRSPLQVCRDKGVCLGNETCCGSPSSCCAASESCCGNGTSVECCQTPIETCCPDPRHGAICCVAENTFCCPPVGSLASRCCPRWNVCCQGGRYGCCDPGNLRAAEDNLGYALFGKGGLEGQFPLYALSIDLNDGKKSSVKTSFDTQGDITRVFAFSPKQQAFFLPQADFDQSPNNVTLYKIAVPSGDLSKVQLAGASPNGLVTGYCDAGGLIFFATYNSQKSGYIFYKADPSSGTVVIVSSHSFTTDDYVGWFKRCSPNGTHVFRMAYQEPTLEENWGIGITDISSPTARPSPWIPVQAPAGLVQYASIDLLSVGGSGNNFTFVSLAPTGDSGGDFALVQWTPGGSTQVLCTFKDAHDTVKFGPISTAVNEEGTQFGALVTTRSLLGNKYDRWELALFSFATSTVTQHDLSPWMIGETDSAAGFGFPAKTATGLEKQ